MSGSSLGPGRAPPPLGDETVLLKARQCTAALPLWECPGSHSPLQTPGLLVGPQTAHGAVPGTAADTGVGGREAADSTEGALGPRWGTRTGRQVVGALGHTQVLLLQQGLKVFSEAKFKMITSGFLLFLSSVRIIIKLRQPLAKLRESCVGVILEVVILQGLQLPVDATLPGCPVQHPPLPGVLGANWMGQGTQSYKASEKEQCGCRSGQGKEGTQGGSCSSLISSPSPRPGSPRLLPGQPPGPCFLSRQLRPFQSFPPVFSRSPLLETAHCRLGRSWHPGASRLS